LNKDQWQIIIAGGATILLLGLIISVNNYIHDIIIEPKQMEPVSEKATKRVTIDAQEKKNRFKEKIVPSINVVYNDLMTQYQWAKKTIDAGEDNDKLAALRAQYNVSDNTELLMALKPHPRSIAIAQAAMESSWATSRFFKEANNIFGVWSFNKSEARIAAKGKRGDKTIWVKKYNSVEDSVRDYYRTLARGRAYKEFRQLKMATDDPYQLVKKLDRYSEKGVEYGKELSAIMRYNKFDHYDQPEGQSQTFSR